MMTDEEMQLELDLAYPPPVRMNSSSPGASRVEAPKIPFVPGCPTCEGKPGDLGLCWNHQLESTERRSRHLLAMSWVSQEVLDQERGLIETMKRDILQAAAEGRPMPWAESPDMTPAERRDFRWRLERAMREIGTVIIQPPPPDRPTRR